ncbi:hypothetical protein RHCRD62_120079 [Rhodococcus sp. RD6.2]|nr:hypothetical protein RHCRD62_120079 [Rhodococcus sp. RD6.2]
MVPAERRPLHTRAPVFVGPGVGRSGGGQPRPVDRSTRGRRRGSGGRGDPCALRRRRRSTPRTPGDDRDLGLTHSITLPHNASGRVRRSGRGLCVE